MEASAVQRDARRRLRPLPRGTVDDKDNLTAALMTMLTPKRLSVPLVGDVIFLSEAGEGEPNFGIQHGAAAVSGDRGGACFAEGAGVTRINGETKHATVQTLEDSARHRAGRARHLGSWVGAAQATRSHSPAVSRIGEWRPDVRFNETTGTYFRKLAPISPPEVARLPR